MIKILVPQQIYKQLISILGDAEENEIGGVLMGEHLSDNTFRIVEISVQSNTGSRSYFLRRLSEALIHLTGFFQRTNRNYKKFNYLGEWHSHPNYVLCPSTKDKETMWDIVHDYRVGANFAVLMLVKLVNGTLQGTALVYLPNYVSIEADLTFES